jgi:hypothetical protein
MTLGEFRAQLCLWGWACDGHDDLALLAAEHPEVGACYRWWDRTARDLANQFVSRDGGPYVRVPDHWALAGYGTGEA